MIDFFAHRWNPELGLQTLCHQVQSTPNVKHAFHIAGVVDTPNLFILISRCSSASNKDNLKSGIVSSDRSSYSDDGLLYIYPQRQLFQIFTQSIDAIDVTSVTLCRLNSINAIDVTGYVEDILRIFLEYFWDILGIFWGYFWYILEIFWRYFGDILGIF